MSTDETSLDYSQILQDFIEQSFASHGKFVNENAALDLASLKGELGELRHEIYEAARKEYEDLVGEDDGEDNSEDSSESSDGSNAGEGTDPTRPGEGPETA
jgi:hypothetical protein